MRSDDLRNGMGLRGLRLARDAGPGLGVVLGDNGRVQSPQLLGSGVVGAGVKFLADDGTYKAVSNQTMAFIAEQVGTGASGTITFASIPQTYRHLRIEWSGSTSAAAGATIFRFRANGVSGATDYMTSWSDVSNEATTAGIAGYTGGTTGGSKSPRGSGFVEFPYYVSTNSKTWVGQYIARVNTTGTPTNDLKFAQGGGVYYTSTAQAAVTQLDFILASGNWTTDTKFSLYGIA